MKSQLTAAFLLLLAGLLILAPSGPVSSQGCVVRPHAAPFYHAPIYHAPYVAPYVAPVVAVTVAEFIPVPIYVPSYGVSYDNGQYAVLKAELDQLKALNLQMMQALKASGQLPNGQLPPVLPEKGFAPEKNSPDKNPPAPAAPVPPNGSAHPGLQVMVTNCAACHEQLVAKAKGGSMVLLQGTNLAPLTGEQRLTVIDDLLKQRMPKGGKLKDEDATMIISLMTSK